VQSYTRHKLKQDRFAETATDAARWAGGHRQTVIWVVGIVVVLAAAVGAFFAWQAHQSEQANFALTKALRTANAQLRAPGEPPQPGVQSFTSSAERGKEAEKQFKEIADKYSLVKAGKVALYMAGTSAIQAGDTQTGESLLKTASESRDQDVAALAKLALANYYRGINKQADAAKIYKDLADHPTNAIGKAEALLELAEMYESSNPQEAANLYKQIQKENPNTAAAQIAAAKLAGPGAER